jgi:hypothetical protein
VDGNTDGHDNNIMRFRNNAIAPKNTKIYANFNVDQSMYYCPFLYAKPIFYTRTYAECNFETYDVRNKKDYCFVFDKDDYRFLWDEAPKYAGAGEGRC